MKRMSAAAAMPLVATLALAVASLAGCTGRKASAPAADAAEVTGTSGRSIKFTVTVDFTGDRPMRGSFVDDDHAGDGSCAAYVQANLPVVGWLGPQTPAGRDVKVAGQAVSYGIMVRHDRFHGPGTYTGSIMSGLSIGQDTFIGPNSSVTINPDGSGSATFADFKNLRVLGRESGSMRWTCSPG